MTEKTVWSIPSPDQVAASRRRAIRERINGPRGQLEALMRLLRDDVKNALADNKRSQSAREIAEEHSRTLEARVPALLSVLDQLPNTSRNGAYSCVFHLLSMMHERRDSVALEQYIRETRTKKARKEKGQKAASRKIQRLVFLRDEFGFGPALRPSKIANAAFLDGGEELNRKAASKGVPALKHGTMVNLLTVLRNDPCIGAQENISN